MELFDTFEDILIEQFDLEYDYLNIEQKDGVEICTIHFHSDVDKDKLNKAVRSINQDEVQRIFKINHLT